MTRFLARLFRRRYTIYSFEREKVPRSELARRYYETHRRLAEECGMECPVREGRND